MRRITLLFIAAVMVLSVVSYGTVSAIEKIDCTDPAQVEAYADFASLQNIPFYDPCSNDSCQVSSGIVTKLSGADNREKIFNYLKARGLTPEQAAGVTGNIQKESGFSPTRQEESQNFPFGGWGIVQWTYGRRNDPSAAKGVVAYLKAKIPDVMENYYSNEYGGGVSESSGFVPKGVPVDANDALLLHELNFLYDESNRREVRPEAVDKIEGAAAGDNEWKTLTKQTTIKNASNLWVYNFEIPANIDTTAAARVISGQTIFDLYNGSSVTADQCSGVNGPTRTKVVALAEKEYAAWESGAKKPGDDFKEYTYGVAGEWCAWFVSWIYKDAGYPVNNDSKPFYSYVGDLVDLAKKNEKFEWHPKDDTYIPQPGDIAIYGDGKTFYHTNIVISAEGVNSITTIGGNEGADDDFSSFTTRGVKLSEKSTYWASEAYGYVSPKG